MTSVTIFTSFIPQREKLYINDIDDTNSFLPEEFTPGPNHCVCARGKGYWDHEGNIRYRAMVAAAAPRYAKSISKLDKSLIVSEIIRTMEDIGGGFVRKERDGRFSECDEHFAREKITQSLRDNLKDMYRSSTSTKKNRRFKACQTIHAKVEQVMQSNRTVSKRMEQLTCDLANGGGYLVEDDVFCTMLSRANSDILESIKKDGSLLQQFHDLSDHAPTSTAAPQ